MVGRATIDPRSYRDTRRSGHPLAGIERTLPRSATARSHSVDAGHERGSWHRQISVFLALFLTMASLFALHEVAQMPLAFSKTTTSSSSIHTIRSFYAGLDEYMETGNASALSSTLAPGALAFAPDEGVLGQDSGLLTYLLALRSTDPELRFTVEQIDTGDDIAIATVRRTGIAGVSVAALPSASETSQEFFRVQDGRIVQHWTTAPASVLQYPLTVPPCRSRSSSAAIWPSPNSPSPPTSRTRNSSPVRRWCSSKAGT